MNFALFKNRNFAFLILSEATSLFGTLFLNIALSLYVLKLTGSAEKFAAVLAIGMIPHFVLGPIAGALADRFDKKKWVVTLDFVRGALCLALFVYSLTNTINMPLIYFTVVFISVCDILFTPVFVSILPSIIDKDNLVDANSFERTMNETMKVASPFLGTLVFSFVGIGPILLIDGLTFFVSGIALSLIKLPEVKDKVVRQVKFLKDVWDGFKVFLIDKRLSSVVANAFLTHAFMYPFILIGIPYMIVQVFGGKETDYGLVESLSTVGSIMAIFFVAPMKRFGVANNIGFGILGMCVPVGLLCFLGHSGFVELLKTTPYLPVAFFGFVCFLLFLSFNFYVVFFASFYQTTVPREMFGRFAAGMMFMNSTGRVLGFQLFGFLFSLDSLIWPVLALGVGMLLKLIVHIPFVRITRQIEQAQRAQEGLNQPA